jgi:hypothetical protein
MSAFTPLLGDKRTSVGQRIAECTPPARCVCLIVDLLERAHQSDHSYAVLRFVTNALQGHLA